MASNTNTKKKPFNNNARVHIGSTNVFKEFSRPDADEAFAKVELAYKIHSLINKLGLTQTQAAAATAPTEPASPT